MGGFSCRLSLCSQSNPAISNSVNSKSLLFRRKIEFPWIYPSPLRFPGYFKTPLFRTFFHFPWDFEIAGFDCIFLIQFISPTGFVTDHTDFIRDYNKIELRN